MDSRAKVHRQIGELFSKLAGESAGRATLYRFAGTLGSLCHNRNSSVRGVLQELACEVRGECYNESLPCTSGPGWGI
jgi:hypothetical protein